MYRSCIFCTAGLGSNDSIERFPVGRSLAFDAAKGRLWAVCPGCARWNLAPLEERWEAIEEAERLFRDTRLRAQRENIGVAKLRDGTRLVRIGRALAAERAVWRYGGQSGAPRWLRGVRDAAADAARGAVRAVPGFGLFDEVFSGSARSIRGRRVMHRLGADGLLIRRWHLETATLAPDGRGGVELQFPYGLDAHPEGEAVRRIRRAPVTLVVGGREADVLLAKAVTLVNRAHTRRPQVLEAVGLLEGFPSPAEFVGWVAGERLPLSRGGFVRLDRVDDTAVLNHRGALALEMAVHEEQERRALDGELAMLAAMWRDAEEVAAIADRLPDVPPPEPPRIVRTG
ncbi:MAG TPA: hypothetical protein VGC13_31590 [Longimicrobium sp.]|jgi:hypothetical protein|uniref:hypothetical protein n=1 Tax=Longimicrobium sp. TaxID=2029185 RepID=UPI002ED9C277